MLPEINTCFDAHPGEVLGVPQKHRPLLSDAVAMVKLHQFIERGEELVPHVVLTAAVLENLEMLNVIPITKLKTDTNTHRA